MDHIHIKSESYKDNNIPDAVMEQNDLDQIKRLAGLTSIGNVGKLSEYKDSTSEMANQGSNPSITANEKIQYQKEHNIQPGTPEWFRLWFSLPYLTGEKPW